MTKILCCSFCLMLPFAGHSQQADDKQLEPQALVCKLSGPELIKRKAELTEQVFSKVQNIEEKEKGYLFRFAYDQDFLITLIDYMLAEQKCCPFFEFDLNIGANNGAIAFTVSGPPKAKEMIKMMLEEGN